MTYPAHEATENRPMLPDGLESHRHRLLTSTRRRLTLDVLAGVTEPVSLSELATGIVAREDGVDAVDEASVGPVSVDLHHVHLPLMADIGIIDYDPETRRIESCPTRADSQNM
ncbi:DUF7344 domain-containing protein [Natrinema marinum]|uniref:DUF7344 domain-containing protein n=1 Tax=Natrinema marinum TaxID=2961598 RepID=UPI0020C92537|nr:hypothetical protein [Natrinema marinum]